MLSASATLVDKELLLATARRVGDQLGEAAYWNKDKTQCNWLSYADITDRDLASSTRVAALSAEIYNGSAGVALFLAELFGASRHPAYRELAAAAWRRSTHYFQCFPPPVPPLSFFAGNLGVAHVGVRLLAHCPELNPELQPAIGWHLAQVRERFLVPHGLDVIGGNAGAIAPLLALAAQPAYAYCHDLARACGDELVATATWQDDKCYWTCQKTLGVEVAGPPLTGFSHGAAGMALALLELYQATGQPRYLHTARGAFAYEELFFSPAVGNWLDTRHPHTVGKDGPQGTFRYAWCHGAPGNMLAYLRAGRLDPERAPYYLSRALAAATTTRLRLQELLNQPLTDATLCHGLCGLADVLLQYGQLTGDEASEAVALEATEQFIARYPDPAHWPSGLHAPGTSPALLVGNAGIGLHLLRAYTHGVVPSILYQFPACL